jgi:hypothetical protein
LNVATICGTLLDITKIDDKCIYWSGNYLNAVKGIDGSLCTEVRSTVEVKVSNEVEIRCFSMSAAQFDSIKEVYERILVEKLCSSAPLKFPKYKLDFKDETFNERFSIGEDITTKISNEPLVCRIAKCKKKIDRERMRLHAGYHILRNETINDAMRCGYCGTLCGHQVKLIKRSSSQTKTPFSTCEAFVKFSMAAAAKISDRSPCTNRPIECLACKEIFWSYNMELHYASKHPKVNIPTEFEITRSSSSLLNGLRIVTDLSFMTNSSALYPKLNRASFAVCIPFNQIDIKVDSSKSSVSSLPLQDTALLWSFVILESILDGRFHLGLSPKQPKNST